MTGPISDPGWGSLVVFGMSGPYTEVPLQALVQGGHRVVLVVEGLERQPRPTFTRHPARGWGAALRGAAPSSLVATAHRLGVDVVRCDDVSLIRTILERVGADAFVVLGFPQLLPPSILGLAPKRGLNVHPGRLPEQRGPSPIFWALKRGEDLACTIHVLTPREDAGDVVVSIPIEAPDGVRYGEILADMAQRIQAPLTQAVRDLLRSDLICSPQKEDAAHRDPRPRFRDGRLNPDRDVRELHRFVRACGQRYSLFVESAGDRFFIADALAVHPDMKLPAEYMLEGERLLLSCEGGVLELALKEDGALFSADY